METGLIRRNIVMKISKLCIVKAMSKKSLGSVFLFLMLMIISQQSVFAQARKFVTGLVLDQEASKTEGRKVPFDNEKNDIKVFYFDTVAEAEDLEKKLKQPNVYLALDDVNYRIPDETGAYDMQVSEFGAIIVKVNMQIQLVKINGQREIITYVDGGIMLDEVEAIARNPIIGPQPPVEVEQYGNLIFLNNANIQIPDHEAKPNSRLIVHPFVINNSRSQEITMYRLPRVYDGGEYALTQNRRMGYELSNDSLGEFLHFDKTISKEKIKIVWNDTVVLPPKTKDSYQVFTWISLEDYTGVYFKDKKALSTRNPRKPLRFLEYSLPNYELDPLKYKEHPKRELRMGVEEVSLNFLLGKAELDPEDPNNELQLNQLKEKLLEIVNGESTTLKELHLSSISSPEGSLAANKALSERRLNYARSLVQSVIPAYTLKRLYTYTPNAARVATWTEVAELLEKDSLFAEATEIRNIVEKYSSQDVQSMNISRLPYYTTLIKERLPRLRTMRCEYTAEIFRELTPDEILYRYQNDPDYRSGKKQFELYEYWHLFNMIKDPKELEILYRRAYEYSKTLNRDKRPWVLAANNLAMSYLKRDTTDVSILEPLINRGVRNVNVERKFDGRVIRVENVEEVVANQLAMYLKEDNYLDATVMEQILPNTERHKKLKAFTRCLGGRYIIKGNMTPAEKQRRNEAFELVKESSDLNRVVMLLAQNRADFNNDAQKAIKLLPSNDPKTLYLKAILDYRLDYSLQAEADLLECFKADPSYIGIAQGDGDIKEDLLKYVMEAYEDYKKELEQTNTPEMQ